MQHHRQYAHAQQLARHMMGLLPALLLLMLCARDARANDCTATMSDISFGSVSPVSGQDYLAMGTLSVTY